MPPNENEYILLTDIETLGAVDDNPNLRADDFSTIFIKISKLSWQMSATYAFSMQMSALVYLLSQLNNSENNLAAITLITSFLNATVCIGLSPLLALGLVAGQELGALDKAERELESEEQLRLRRDHIAAVFGNGLIVSAVMSPFMIASLVFSEPLLVGVFGQNETIARIAADFIRLYAITIPGIMLRVCADQVMFTFKKTKHAMCISLISFPLCMSLGSILAFGKLGSPRLGANGLLVGCILDNYIGAAAYLLYLAKYPSLQNFHFFNIYRPWHQNLDQLKKIRRLGSSMLFTMTTETVMGAASNAFAGIVGVPEQAAFSAIMQFSLFSLLLQIAFGQTSAQEMSYEIGENAFLQASRIGKVGLVALLVYIVPVLTVLSAYPNILVDMIGNNNQALKNILQYLAPIMFLGCILDAERVLLLQQMRALGDTDVSSFISASCVVLGIVLSGVLGLKTTMGIYGVATGFTASAGLATLLLLPRWLKRIEPTAIENNKKHPEQISIGCCSVFFSRKQPQVLDNKISILNPISRSFSCTMNDSETA